MRMIKFRVWDKKTKCWWNINGLSFTENGEIASIDGCRNIQGVHAVIENVPWNKDFELIQYTGLKDNKKLKKVGNKVIADGDEIYESDIVKYFAGASTFIHPVVFEEGIAMVNDWSLNYIAKQLNAKIIGNIWENPELLKV